MIPPNFSFIICIFVSKLALLLFLTVKNRIYLTIFIGVFYPIFRHEILELLPGTVEDVEVSPSLYATHAGCQHPPSIQFES